MKEFDGRGGEGRRKAMTYITEQKRARELPEVLRKIGALPDELMAVLRKRAKIAPNVAVKEMTVMQRAAMRDAAHLLYLEMERKTQKARSAFMLFTASVTSQG